MQNLHKKSYKSSTNKAIEIREKLYYNENAFIKSENLNLKECFKC